MAPSEVLLGTNLVRAGEWAHPCNQTLVRNRAVDREERLTRARNHQQEYIRELFPQPRRAHKHFLVGDQVLVRTFAGTSTAFSPPWSGPFPIVAVRGDGTYEVDRNGSRHLVHIDDLRPVAGLAAMDDAPNADLPGPGPRQPVPAAMSQSSSSGEPVSRPHRSEPSSRPINFIKFDDLPEAPRMSPTPTIALQQLNPEVAMEDFPEDPGDPGETRPVPGLIPVVGLFP